MTLQQFLRHVGSPDDRRPHHGMGRAGPGRGLDRLPTLMQCVYLHVFLSCEHKKADLLRLELLASDTSSIEGGPPSMAEPRGEHFL